jgi:hypothetical protein
MIRDMRENLSSPVMVAGPGAIIRVCLTAFLIVIGFGLLFFANFTFAEASPGGNDFLVHWVGGRYILQGKNPYGEDAAREIQMLVYGRTATAGEHQLRVAYPYYGELLLLPFAFVGNYSVARAAWMVLMEVAQMGLALAALASFDLSGAFWRKVLFLLFSLSWYFGARALINGNAVIVVGLLITLSAWLLKKNRYGALAGMLLATATMKPQVSFWPVLFLLAFSVKRERYRFLLGFFGAMALFFTLSFLLLPTWIRDFAMEVVRYPSYNPPYTPAAILADLIGGIGSAMGWAISILALIGLAIILWKKCKPEEGTGLMTLLGLVMTLSFLSGIPNDPGNEAILILPIAGIFLAGWKKSNGMAIFQWALVLPAIWVGLWGFFLMTIQCNGQPVQSSVILFPLPAFLLAGWYMQSRLSNRILKGTIPQ